MLGITNPWTYVLGTVAIVLLPGPNSLYVLSVAARRGVRDGYRGAAGVWLGDAALMTLSAGGVASLLHAYSWLFSLVKYAGALYLAYVGVRLVVDTVRRLRRPSAATGPAAAADRPFRRALVVSLLNPKAILFLISFFVQFVDPGYAYPALSFLLLGALLQTGSFLYLSALIFGGTRLATAFRRRKRLSAGATSAAGALFLGFAAKLTFGSV
jgi:leucine efflux protein